MEVSKRSTEVATENAMQTRAKNRIMHAASFIEDKLFNRNEVIKEEEQSQDDVSESFS